MAGLVGRYVLVADADGRRFWRGGNVMYPPNDFLIAVMNSDAPRADGRVGRVLDFDPEAWPLGSTLEVREP